MAGELAESCQAVMGEAWFGCDTANCGSPTVLPVSPPLNEVAACQAARFFGDVTPLISKVGAEPDGA